MKPTAHTLPRPLTYDDINTLARAIGGIVHPEGRSTLKIMLNPYQSGTRRCYLKFESDGAQVDGKEYFSTSFGKVTCGDLGKNTLVAALMKLSPGCEDLKKELSKGLELPAETEGHRDMLRMERDMARDAMDHVKALNESHPPLANHRMLPLNRGAVKIVVQGECRILKPEDKESSLGTGGVAPCVVVIFRNPVNQHVGMAHISCWEDLPLLEKMRAGMQASAGDNIEVMLWGGRKNVSEELVTHISTYLYDHPEMVLTAVDVCNPKRQEQTLESFIAVSRAGETRMDGRKIMSLLEPAATRAEKEMAGLLKAALSHPAGDKGRAD